MPYLPLPKRTIDTIFVHCTATVPYRNVTAKDIDKWHKARGWSGIGYNLVLLRDGSTQIGRDVDRVPAGVKGHNRKSLHIVLVGGLGTDNRPSPYYPRSQMETLSSVLDELTKQHPQAAVRGHYEVANKACPCFDVREWWYGSGEVRPSNYTL